MVGLSFRPLHLKLYYLNIKMEKNSLQTLPTKGVRSAEKPLGRYIYMSAPTGNHGSESARRTTPGNDVV